MLVQLEAWKFRNLEPLNQTLSAGTHLVLGDNGAGKTSLLEAIYLLGTTRSFRTPRVADCCRHGSSQLRLAGEIDTGVRSRLELSWQAGKRERFVNGQRTNLADHLAILPLVCWSAGDGELLTGPPAGRRRFLDRGVIGVRPAALAALARYRHALREKRQLLQRGGGEVEVWNQVLATSAAEIIRLRADYVDRLRTALREVLEICALELPPIELHYRCSPLCGLDGAAEIELSFNAAIERERVVRQPLEGPHRDDLLISWGEQPVHRVASAGERKALGLALFAAQGRILDAQGKAPIYLLDDADTELDAGRLEALWRFFGTQRQLLATSNRAPVWHRLEVDRRWHCQAGRVHVETVS